MIFDGVVFMNTTKNMTMTTALNDNENFEKNQFHLNTSLDVSLKHFLVRFFLQKIIFFGLFSPADMENATKFWPHRHLLLSLSYLL